MASRVVHNGLWPEEFEAVEMQQGAVIAGQLQPQLTPPPSAAPAAPTEGRAAHEPAEPTFDGDLDRP